MKGIVYNLPKEGNFHTFICDHGNTHLISFQFPAEIKEVSSRPDC